MAKYVLNKSEEKIEYGALMLEFDIPNWENIIKIVKEVDLFEPEEFGYEKNSHLTLLYGFHNNVKGDDFDEILNNVKPITVEVLGVSIFGNKESGFDVVKLEVKENKTLLDIREKAKTLPNTLTFKEYNPHITLAYVKSGKGKKYIHKFNKEIKLSGDKIVFSSKRKERKVFNLVKKVKEIFESNSIMNEKNNVHVKNYITKLKTKPFINGIINQLNGEVYLVGGAVRDLFFNKKNKDIDLVVRKIDIDTLTNFLSKYGRVSVEGESFGVIIFKSNDDGLDYDIALPRVEKSTGGGHKDFEINTDKDIKIEDDLIRRDATINSIAINVGTGKIVDPLNGLDDIKNKEIKMTNPKAFADDPLRMLRIIGFASRFDLKIGQQTFEVIKSNASNINEIVKERFYKEFNKIIEKKGNKKYFTQLLIDTGLYNSLFKIEPATDIVGYWDDNIWKNIVSLSELYFLMVYPVHPKDLGNHFVSTLKGDTSSKKEIMAFELAYNNYSDTSKEKNRHLIFNMYNFSKDSVNSKILPEKLMALIGDMKRGKYPIDLKSIVIDGNVLMKLGFKGVDIGNKQKEILKAIYSDKVKNLKSELIKYIIDNDTKK